VFKLRQQFSIGTSQSDGLLLDEFFHFKRKHLRKSPGIVITAIIGS